MLFKPNDLILFQGDSITDCSRNRQDGASLGNGYAMMAASWLTARYPALRLRFLNHRHQRQPGQGPERTLAN